MNVKDCDPSSLQSSQAPAVVNNVVIIAQAVAELPAFDGISKEKLFEMAVKAFIATFARG